MDLEILNHAVYGMKAEALSAHEELYYPTVVGTSLRCFEGEVLDARIRFLQRAKNETLCTIEVETFGGPISCEGRGASRSAAFLYASEQLERRLFEGLYWGASLDDSYGGPTLIAA